MFLCANKKVRIYKDWKDYMFRIEKPEMINKTFRLPLELVEKLSKVAQNQNISLNNLVKQCCEYALSNLDENSSQK